MGRNVGIHVGFLLGLTDGVREGRVDVGRILGDAVGRREGDDDEGLFVGRTLGGEDGLIVGVLDGEVGPTLGTRLGKTDGLTRVGIVVG